MSGKVEAIWTKRAHRGEMDAVDGVTLVAGKGIQDDANFGRSKRQVTVIEKEVLDRIRAELPDVDPKMRRANFMVSGIRLENTRGHVLTLGGARVQLYGETRPCERMDAQVPGFTAALDPSWSGGAHGVVLDDGEVRVGDAASIEEGHIEETAAAPPTSASDADSEDTPRATGAVGAASTEA